MTMPDPLQPPPADVGPLVGFLVQLGGALVLSGEAADEVHATLLAVARRADTPDSDIIGGRHGLGRGRQRAATQANMAAQAQAFQDMQQQAQIYAAVVQTVAAQATAAPAPASAPVSPILDDAEFAAAKLLS